MHHAQEPTKKIAKKENLCAKKVENFDEIMFYFRGENAVFVAEGAGKKTPGAEGAGKFFGAEGAEEKNFAFGGDFP